MKNYIKKTSKPNRPNRPKTELHRTEIKVFGSIRFHGPIQFKPIQVFKNWKYNDSIWFWSKPNRTTSTPSWVSLKTIIMTLSFHLLLNCWDLDHLLTLIVLTSIIYYHLSNIIIQWSRLFLLIFFIFTLTKDWIN